MTPALDLPSRESRRLIAEVCRLARHASMPLCFVGPSGTGKSLYAREVHRLSPRREAPYVYLNLASVPKSLAASELRGHQRGAFTGAVDRRIGRLASAHGGTLTLDEVTKASRPVQYELLQIFDRTPITPIGSDREVILDARLIALSSIPLEQAVRTGKLIADLYERLKPFVLEIAPLSERVEDIPVVLATAVGHHAPHFGYATPPTIDPALLVQLQRRRFTGNHREVDGLAQRLLANAEGSAVLLPRHLPQTSASDVTSLRSKRERYETDRREAAPRRFATVRDEAAFYEVSEATLYRWKGDTRAPESSE